MTKQKQIFKAHIRIFELTEENSEPIQGINNFIHCDDITGGTIKAAYEKALNYINANLKDEITIINIHNENNNCIASFSKERRLS